MLDLKEMVLLLDTHYGQWQAELGHPGENRSKLGQLYDGILKGTYPTDEAAAADLYPEGNLGSNYRKLKADLRERLINTILEVNPRNFTTNEYQKAYYDCHRQWAATKILFGRNATAAAVTLARKVLRNSLRFEFTQLSLDALGMLRMHYGARLGDAERFAALQAEFEQLEEIVRLENLAEAAYIQASMHFVNSKAATKTSREQIQAQFARLAPYMPTQLSYRFQLHARLVELYVAMSNHDYSLAAQVCRAAIDFFLEKPYEAHVPLQIFYFQELNCYVHLRDFSTALQSAENCHKLLGKGSFNWFRYMESLFQLSMHTRNYQQALTLYLEATQERHFEFQPEPVLEIWRIHGAYLYFLFLLKKLTLPGRANPFKDFQLSQLLQSTPVFRSDKRGMNVAILVVQILILLAEKKYDEFVDRADSIEQYAYRYLKKGETLRSHYFIKMLLQIPLGRFIQQEVLRKAQKYQEKLRSQPLDLGNQLEEIEILPFDDAWELVVEKLEPVRPKNKFSRRR